MDDFIKNPRTLVKTLARVFSVEKSTPEFEVLDSAAARVEQTGYDNWDGGTDVYSLYLQVPVGIYGKYSDLMEQIEKSISDKIQPLMRQYPGIWLTEVVVSPNTSGIGEDLPGGHSISPARATEVKRELQQIQALMIAYVTGGREPAQPDKYHELYVDMDIALEELGYENPNLHKSLEIFWDSCGKQGLGTYASRRAYVHELYGEIILDLDRRLRKVPEPRHWKQANAALSDTLKPIRTQWLKAKNFIHAAPPDYQNSVKESINSIESALKILLGRPGAALGQLVKEADIDPDIGRILSCAYGVVSNKDFVRHGGVTDEPLAQGDAEFFLEFAAVSIIYLKQKLYTPAAEEKPQQSDGR